MGKNHAKHLPGPPKIFPAPQKVGVFQTYAFPSPLLAKILFYFK